MRQRHMLLVLTFIAASCLGRMVQAGNVLLPPENPNTAGTPNLGFMPSEAQPQESQPVTAGMRNVAPVQVGTSTPAVLKGAPAPQSAGQLMPLTMQPAISRPPASSPPPAHNLTISLVQSSFMNAFDIMNVSSLLGLPAGLVARQCHLGFTGLLITDRGTVAVDSNQMASANAAYEGAVSNATISTYVACTSAPKPAPFAAIQKLGDAYSVVLSSAFCTPASPFAGTQRQLSIRHGMNGNDSCAYQ